MPVGQALLAGTEGAAFGFFPILWIVINAIWVYNMTVETGHFDVLRRSFAKVSDDQRIQAVIIAFCFGALLEALAGFGTPVAITSVMLIALGFRPIKAATVALVANTAPVAFGALAVPITTLATVDRPSPSTTLGADGRPADAAARRVRARWRWSSSSTGRGVRQTLPADAGRAASPSPSRSSPPPTTSPCQLTDIVASLVGAAVGRAAAAGVAAPRTRYVEEPRPTGRGRRGASAAVRPTVGAAASRGGDAGRPAGRPGAAARTTPVGMGTGTADELGARDAAKHDSPGEVVRAYAPYLIIIALFIITQLPGRQGRCSTAPTKVLRSGRACTCRRPAGKPSTLPTFKLNWLSAAGTLLVIAGLITIPVDRHLAAPGLQGVRRHLPPAGRRHRHGHGGPRAGLRHERLGPDRHAGGLDGRGRAAFALISPILGWLGVAVTGSDTSSNSLFGALQVTAANQTGLNPVLMAAANSSGGVLGKMISPQNLAIAAAAVGLSGREGDLFRKVLGWSLGFLAFMCVLVYLQSTPVLSWMVP